MDAELSRRALDLARRAEKYAAPANTGFLTPAEQAELRAFCARERLDAVFHGGGDENDRRAAFFLPSWMEEDALDVSEAIAALEITAAFGAPGHRDYLGAILGLGIKRDCLGDIRVAGSTAYLFCLASIAPYLCANLESVGRCGVKIRQIALSDVPPLQRSCREVRFTVKSLRLDSVLAGAFALSRARRAQPPGQGQGHRGRAGGQNPQGPAIHHRGALDRRSGKEVTMHYPQVGLRPGEERDLRTGKLWIYENELEWAEDTCQNGDIVAVLDAKERFAAYGFFNALSKITVRVLSFDEGAVFDREFFRDRIQRAWDFRRALGFSDACRVVFGESDGLPGLTVDKFGDYLSFQIVSLGMERRKQEIIDILAEIFAPKGIFERDDLAVREKEGMEQHGQKTGHFLDQQENRGRIAPYVKNETVLDLCCCTGGFSVHAALYGAKSVEAVDVSAEALALTMENARRNGVAGRVTVTEANVFDLARAYADAGRQFGCVICDPPAFAKSRRALDAAWRGYKELNLRAIRMVRPGGFLVSCSCSQSMTPELFLQMLREAAADAGRSVRLLEALLQSRDHPACLGAEQALYLKGYILQVI